MPLYLKHSRLFSAGVRIEYRVVCVYARNLCLTECRKYANNQTKISCKCQRSKWMCVFTKQFIKAIDFFFHFHFEWVAMGVTTKPVLKTRLSCSFISPNCCLFIKSYPRIARESWRSVSWRRNSNLKCNDSRHRKQNSPLLIENLENNCRTALGTN